ncbi:polysaccharide lyase [Actinocatenispora rupis]|uniref:Polysaccharide lyase n=1 Tax=Actinocatenispora rupis TaxID=519421 RepID=A0A8J3J8T9_9ACTN|nr:polysaccharide lyase [Actinocatenispora rupis]GID12267.1 hypothetical protein Aru02nite_31560 [Actinocatenispora rupis]
MASRRRILAYGAALAAGTLGAAALPAGAASADTTVFADGFEGTDFGAWTRQRIDGNGAMDLVTDPVLAGAQSARFTVPNDGVSYRSEVAHDAFGFGSYSYEFADLVPSDWVTYQYGTILAQWHGYPLADGSDTNPPLSLIVKETYWQFKVHWLDDTGAVQETTLSLPDVTFGAWNRWRIDVTWSTPDTPGSLRIWLNDNQVASYDGVNNYHQNQEPYFKLGIYRPNWNPAKGIPYPTGGPPVVVYDDAVTVTALG